MLAELAGKVCSIEVIPELAASAARALATQGCGNVELRTGDGGLGWPERAPFDAIIVTAAAPTSRPRWSNSCAPAGAWSFRSGRITAIRNCVLITKDAAGTVTRRTILPVAFVPLTGE